MPSHKSFKGYKADVYVTLKRTVNDPQGLTIRNGLHALGFESVGAVRAGKFIEVWLEAEDEQSAQQQAAAMSDQLLANPVIEDFRINLQPASDPASPPIVDGDLPASPPIVGGD